MRWLVEYDSHKEKKGDIFEGEELPLYLHGKVKELSDSKKKERVLEVSTPSHERQTKQQK